MRTLAIGILTVLAVGLAADLALIQPGDVAARLAAKGAGPRVSKHSEWLPANFLMIVRLFSTAVAVRGATARM
jgi:hypothetical protein